MNTPDPSSERPLNDYLVNIPADTRELVARLREDGSLFQSLSTEWKYWFACHPEHLGEHLTQTLVYATGLPDVIHFLPDRLQR